MTTPPDGTAVTVVDVVVIGMSVAGEKLWAVGDDILGQEGPTAEYDAVPRVTFTDPEIGAVGLTEAQARDRGINVATGAGGPAGGEALSRLAVAVHGRVPVNRLRRMIYAYPTFHRGIEDAPRELDT